MKTKEVKRLPKYVYDTDKRARGEEEEAEVTVTGVSCSLQPSADNLRQQTLVLN